MPRVALLPFLLVRRHFKLPCCLYNHINIKITFESASCTRSYATGIRDQRRRRMADNASPDLLQQQQIPDLPPKMFYIPNIITEDEEQRILDKVRLYWKTPSFITLSILSNVYHRFLPIAGSPSHTAACNQFLPNSQQITLCSLRQKCHLG